MTGVVFRIHLASLTHLAFLLHSLSITFAPSQSMMLLFLSAWSVIADLSSITADTLFCSLVNHLVVMFSTSFLCPSSLVPNVLPVSSIYVWLQLLQGSGIHSLSLKLAIRGRTNRPRIPDEGCRWQSKR